jgi:uncharacterized delta-60 repeat protein
MIVDDSSGYSASICEQKDGKILLGALSFPGTASAYLSIRLNTNGTLDLTYGDSGRARTNMGTFVDGYLNMCVDSLGRAILAGGADNSVAVIRLLQNGTLDTSFGANGLFAFRITENQNAPRNVKIQDDQKIVLLGSMNGFSNMNSFVVRLKKDGDLDTAWNYSGYTLSGSEDILQTTSTCLAIHKNRVIVGSTTYDSLGPNLLLQRYYVNDERKPEKVFLFDFNLFPNPVNDQSRIVYKLTEDAMVTIKVFDMSGRLICIPVNNFRQYSGYHTTLLNLPEGISHGVYILQLTTANQIKRVQFLK